MNDEPRAIKTNGIGQKTTSHLNLIKTMEAQVAQEAADRASHVHWSAEHRKAKGA